MNKNAQFDVTALGEILIDFTSAGISVAGQALFERNAGGAPANVAVAVTRLGGRSAFIGKTGADPFGRFLEKTLRDCGVHTSGMRVDPAQHTTLAFVSLSDSGERTFSFCRNPGADTTLSADELDLSILQNTRILHIGSLSLTHKPCRSATRSAIECVRQAGGLISYDPNWRASLWPDRASALTMMLSLMPLADIVKVSDEELELLYGTADLQAGAQMILDQGPSLVLITLGKKGAFFKTRTASGTVPAPPVNVIDTTGAGDSFIGGMLTRIAQAGEKPFERPESDFIADLNFANAVASLCVMKRGAIPAIPTLNAVASFLRGAS